MPINLDYIMRIHVPSVDQAPIYFQFLNMELDGQLGDCESNSNGDLIRVYDGGDTFQPLIGSYCGVITPSDWIKSSKNMLTLRITTNAIPATFVNNKPKYFEAMYYSAHYHPQSSSVNCGITHLPFNFKSPSMYLTDGSPMEQKNLDEMRCNWVIQPEVRTTSATAVDDDSSGVHEIVLAFQRVNLKNSKLTIYDGSFANSDYKIWECDGCEQTPFSLSAFSGSMYVDFESYPDDNDFAQGEDEEQLVQGTGFSAFYRSVVRNLVSDEEVARPLVLRMPDVANDALLAKDFTWKLPIFKYDNDR